MSGFIKLHRGWRANGTLREEKPFHESEAWLWVLEHTAWKALTRTSGRGRAVHVSAGHIHVSERSLASAWGWDRKRVRRFLRRLCEANMLSRGCPESDGANAPADGTIYVVVNWAKYQNSEPTSPPQTAPIEDQSRTTQEEGKEGKEEKKEGYAFFGRVVRLTPEDLARWEQAYHFLDVQALLRSRDDWLRGQPEKDQKRWFRSTSSWLANKQQEAFAAKQADKYEYTGVGPC